MRGMCYGKVVFYVDPGKKAPYPHGEVYFHDYIIRKKNYGKSFKNHACRRGMQGIEDGTPDDAPGRHDDAGPAGDEDRW